MSKETNDVILALTGYDLSNISIINKPIQNWNSVDISEFLNSQYAYFDFVIFNRFKMAAIAHVLFAKD